MRLLIAPGPGDCVVVPGPLSWETDQKIAAPALEYEPHHATGPRRRSRRDCEWKRGDGESRHVCGSAATAALTKCAFSWKSDSDRLMESLTDTFSTGVAFSHGLNARE